MRLSAESVANDVRMRRQLFGGSILLVEGSIDARFIKRFIDEANCLVIVAHGRENALSAINILTENGFPGALALIDADFDRVLGSVLTGPNVVSYDYRDLEIMLLASPALDKLLREYASEYKVRNFEASEGMETRQALLLRAQEIGLLRLISNRDSLALRFDGLNFGFVDPKTLQLNVRELIVAVKNNSRRHGLDTDDLLRVQTELKNYGFDLLETSAGHDALELLAIGLRRVLGSQDHVVCDSEFLEKCLRLSYEEEYFLGTMLYKAIRAWEEENPMFKVLR
jgi:hypothetical protein